MISLNQYQQATVHSNFNLHKGKLIQLRNNRFVTNTLQPVEKRQYYLHKL